MMTPLGLGTTLLLTPVSENVDQDCLTSVSPLLPIRPKIVTRNLNTMSTQQTPTQTPTHFPTPSSTQTPAPSSTQNPSQILFLRLALPQAIVVGSAAGFFLLLLLAICIALVVIAAVLVTRGRQKSRTGAGQQCGGTAGGPTGARRPLPPVVLVTHDPMYEEIPDCPPHDQVNCLREECTGQQKVMVEGHSGEVGKVPTQDGNSPLYHTLEPDPHAADEDLSEAASDYVQPVSSKELDAVDQKLTIT